MHKKRSNERTPKTGIVFQINDIFFPSSSFWLFFSPLVLQQSPIPGPYRGPIEVAQVLLLLQGGTLKRASNGACAVCVCVCVFGITAANFFHSDVWGVFQFSHLLIIFISIKWPDSFFYPIDISIAIQIDFFPPLKSDVFSQCSFNFLSCVILYLTVHYTPNSPTRLLQAEAWP